VTENPEIRLNPDPDVGKLKDEFAKDKRLSIPDILVPEAAERLHHCLVEEIAWNLTYNDDNGEQHLFASKLGKMSAAERAELQQKVLNRARAGKFQFLFGSPAATSSPKWQPTRRPSAIPSPAG